jgi:hypothetical protein
MMFPLAKIIQTLAVATLLSMGPADAKMLSRRDLLSVIHRHLNREQCEADTEAMVAANPDLTAALTDYGAEYDAAQEACGDDSNSCVIDEDDFASTGPFKEACVAAGGEIWEYDYAIQCKGTVEGKSETLTFSFLNVDECYPASSTACDPGDIVAEMEGEVTAAEDNLAAFLGFDGSDGASIDCGYGLSVTNPSGDVVQEVGSTSLLSAAPETSVLAGAVLAATSALMMMMMM